MLIGSFWRTSSRDKRENGEYQAVGIEAHDDANGSSIILRARKEIIVSAGYVQRLKTLLLTDSLFRTYNSPVILMHSGVGPRGHLTEMNIDCKVDLPGVGENLLDHPLVRRVFLPPPSPSFMCRPGFYVLSSDQSQSHT